MNVLMKEAMIVVTVASTLLDHSTVNATVALYYKKMETLVMVNCIPLLASISIRMNHNNYTIVKHNSSGDYFIQFQI